MKITVGVMVGEDSAAWPLARLFKQVDIRVPGLVMMSQVKAGGAQFGAGAWQNQPGRKNFHSGLKLASLSDGGGWLSLQV